MITIHATQMHGERYAIRADWSQADSPIEHEGLNGEWYTTGHQVAEYQHYPRRAMLALLRQAVRDSGDDPKRLVYASAIARALDKMT